MINLGSYKQHSSKIIIAYPIFKKDKMFTISLKNVLKGKWNTFVLKQHDETTELLSLHNDINVGSSDEFKWKYIGYIPVESRVIGIFDLKFYLDNSVYGENNKDIWFKQIKASTLESPNYASVVPYGVVSDTYYEDGLYDVYYTNINSKVVGIKIDLKN